MNWYTKRALLAGVYTATELYMLTDYSPGYAETWDALDRRLRDVMALGRAASQVRQRSCGKHNKSMRLEAEQMMSLQVRSFASSMAESLSSSFSQMGRQADQRGDH